jgi:hypothetical protein
MYVIVGESDLFTDKKLHYPLSIGKKVDIIKAFESKAIPFRLRKSTQTWFSVNTLMLAGTIAVAIQTRWKISEF